MNRDDRLFAIIGGTVVTAAATVFLVFAGGITGTIEDRPTIRVAPNPVVKAPERPTEIVKADFEEPEPTLGDDFVRALTSRISAHPKWASWIVTDRLVERFVACVEAVADGYSPRSELGFVATGSPFLVREDEGRLVIAAGTFRRYDLAVEVFNSLDADAVVTIIHELQPVIDEARKGVAWHRGDFEGRLRQAIDHLLEVEVPTGVIEVERRTRTYAFAEDDHERLSDAQRQLLRMGRKNATLIQAKLLTIRRAFDWPAAPVREPVRRAVFDREDVVVEEPVVVAEAVVEPVRSEENGSVTIIEPALEPFQPPVWSTMPPALIAVDGAAAPSD